MLVTHRVKTGMIVLSAEIEIRILKKQIQIGGPSCCSFDGHPPRTGDEVLETNIEIVIIQTDSVMGIGTVTVMAHPRAWIDMEPRLL